MKRLSITLLILLGIFGIFIIFGLSSVSVYTFFPESKLPTHLFLVQSIDTMKYSRDLAEEKLYDVSFNSVINAQMKLISDSGATHVAIDTPYDEKFTPILSRWVSSARAHHLSVWFRGNFSGWEGWFSYPKIDRATHKKMLKEFILSHEDLFENGDIFTPCPECENGGPGDPRQTGDKEGYNSFLIEEYNIVSDVFNSVEKLVVQYPSMNADIAREIIDKKTAEALGGTILIDHYVNYAEKFSNDLTAIGKKLNANIGIGEFGAPIEDINGSMNKKQQAQFIQSLFDIFYPKANQLPVVNYWSLQGGSTALVSDRGVPYEAYFVIKSYFSSPKIFGMITNSLGEKIKGVTILVADTTYTIKSEENGMYVAFLPAQLRHVSIEKEGYKTIFLDFPQELASTTRKDIILEPTHSSLWYRFQIITRAIKARLFSI